MTFFNQDLDVGFISHVGVCRTENQDQLACHHDKSLYIVADGMGGHRGGARAAKIAVEQVGIEFKPGENFHRSIFDAIDRAHLAIGHEQNSHIHEEQMGTTLVCCHLIARKAYIYWVGDSRCYVYSARKKTVTQKSRDHSVVQDLIDQRKISPESAKEHPQRHVITQSLGIGHGAPNPGSAQYEGEEGDVVVLCSDGLSNEIEEFDILRACQQEVGAQKIAESLTRMALDGGGRDNITVICLRL